MPYTAAKCPNCGASIDVDSEAKFSRCEFCGSTMEPQKAIAKLSVELGGKVEVKGVSTVENDIIRGRQRLEVEDWDGAYKIFSEAVDKDATCFEAWFGCLKARSMNFSTLDVNPGASVGVMNLASIVRNAAKYVQGEGGHAFINDLNRWDAMLVDTACGYKEKKAQQQRLQKAFPKDAMLLTLSCLGFYIALGFAVALTDISGRTSLAAILLVLAVACLFMTGLSIVKLIRKIRAARKTITPYEVKQIEDIETLHKAIRECVG